jgi:hypothetical protein
MESRAAKRPGRSTTFELPTTTINPFPWLVPSLFFADVGPRLAAWSDNTLFRR